MLLHEGIVPHTHLALSIGVAHGWDEGQLCWKPVLGADGQTSLEGVRIAGDAGGINGWHIAELDGRLAGLAVAAQLGKGVSTGALRQARARLARLRPFLDAWYRPRAELLAPADDVIVCRCEEKTAGAIRAAIREGCLGPNQVKAATRCGMGPCQGRECGLTLTTLIAAERDVTPAEAGFLSIRPPLKPLMLGELASLAPSEG
jgi:bacterioferritin-associated ferredoxin